jgi:hypothetical protein
MNNKDKHKNNGNTKKTKQKPKEVSRPNNKKPRPRKMVNAKLPKLPLPLPEVEAKPITATTPPTKPKKPKTVKVEIPAEYTEEDFVRLVNVAAKELKTIADKCEVKPATLETVWPKYHSKTKKYRDGGIGDINRSNTAIDVSGHFGVCEDFEIAGEKPENIEMIHKLKTEARKHAADIEKLTSNKWQDRIKYWQDRNVISPDSKWSPKEGLEGFETAILKAQKENAVETHKKAEEKIEQLNEALVESEKQLKEELELIEKAMAVKPNDPQLVILKKEVLEDEAAIKANNVKELNEQIENISIQGHTLTEEEYAEFQKTHILPATIRCTGAPQPITINTTTYAGTSAKPGEGGKVILVGGKGRVATTADRKITGTELTGGCGKMPTDTLNKKHNKGWLTRLLDFFRY